METTKFQSKSVSWSLKDIGSNLIDQLARDVYTRSECILREVVKNAYDAYVALDQEDADETEFVREITLKRDRDENGVGRLFITDKGIGQNLQEIKKNLQISKSDKPETLDGATGFRGLGSWALIEAGSTIVITSRRKGDSQVCRLKINVQTILEKMGPTVTLDDILNDSHCVSFAARPAHGQDEPHFTQVEIACDGPQRRVGAYEVNRLYPLTDPNADGEGSLSDIVLRSCQIPFAPDSPAHDKIAAIYQKINYRPTRIVVDGHPLLRRLPLDLSEIDGAELEVDGKLVAYAWFASHPTDRKTCTKYITDDTNLVSTGIQVLKVNSPIGEKNLYATKDQGRLLDWYIGEVHIRSGDVQPDASGLGLRQDTARDAFLTALSIFYDKLAKRARLKSTRLNNIDKLQAAVAAIKELKDGTLGDLEKIDRDNRVKIALTLVNGAKKKSVKNGSDDDDQDVWNEPELANLRKKFRSALKNWDPWNGINKKKSDTTKKKKQDADKSGKSTTESDPLKTSTYISVEDFQARLGLAIPRFKDLGFDDQDISSILQIINEIVTAKTPLQASA